MVRNPQFGIQALVIDETRRVLGDHWVENLQRTTRRPNITADNERNAREQVRKWLGDEIKAFDNRPYLPHPDYDKRETDIEETNGIESVSVSTFTSLVDNAVNSFQSGDCIALIPRTEKDKDVQTILVFEVSNDKIYKVAETTINTKDYGVTERLRTLADDYTQATSSGSEFVDETVIVESEFRNFTDEEEEEMFELIYDEMRRISGDEWVERAKSRERGNGLSVISGYCHQVDADDSFLPITESTLREYARLDMKGTLIHFDSQFEHLHPDYDGDYDPNNMSRSDEEEFINVLQDAEMMVTEGDTVAIWDGRVNVKDDEGRITERTKTEPERGSALVYAYTSMGEGEAPQQVYHTGYETSGRVELESKLRETAERHDKRFN